MRYVLLFWSLDKQHARNKTHPKMVKGKGNIEEAVSLGSVGYTVVLDGISHVKSTYS